MTRQKLEQQAQREARWLARWQTRSLLTWLLLPLGWLFEKATQVRRWLFRYQWRAQYRVPIPVVVVGGIMVGGVGKTPVVARLVNDLKQAGLHPAIISRGYGSLAEHQQASAVTEHYSAADVGDEPLQLWMQTGVPVWVGKNRIDVARALCAAHPECDVLVCDDGLQHYRLYRDIEVVVVDERGVGNGWCLPAGSLREPPTRLNEVFAVLRHRRGEPKMIENDGHALSTAYFPQPLIAPIFTITTELAAAYALSERRQIQPLADFAGQKKLLKLAGIARPQVFFEMLDAHDVTGETLALPDHAAFDASLAKNLLAREIDIIMLTEKDAVKCLPWCETYPELARKIWVVPLVVQDSEDWRGFSKQVVVCLNTLNHHLDSSIK